MDRSREAAGFAAGLPVPGLTGSHGSYGDHVAVTRNVRRFSGGGYDLGLHVAGCPEYRRPVLGGRGAVRLDELIRQKAEERGWEIIAVEVTPEHVHLFVRHGPEAPAS
jgi:putative transposase